MVNFPPTYEDASLRDTQDFHQATEPHQTELKVDVLIRVADTRLSRLGILAQQDII